MNTKYEFDAIAFAKTSAIEAFDQYRDYMNINHAIKTYRQNLYDTCGENGVHDYELIKKALLAYDEKVEELRAKLPRTVPTTLQYQKVADCDASVYHTVTFDNLEDAQLWYDTILYLRRIYIVNSPRPY